MDGGQSFRWQKNHEGIWIGPLGNTLVSLRPIGSKLQWRTCRISSLQ
jgi:hypothetical protein